MTRPPSFKSIKSKWLKDLKEYGNHNAEYLLIGNKNDLAENKAVSTEEGQKFANKIKASEFIETSAQSGENVEDAFKALLLNVITSRNK